MGLPFEYEDVSHRARLTELGVGANGVAQEQVTRFRHQHRGRKTDEVAVDG